MKNLNLKQRITLGIIISAFSTLILFLAGSFANASFNITNWSVSTRTAISFVWVIAIIVCWVITLTFDD